MAPAVSELAAMLGLTMTTDELDGPSRVADGEQRPSRDDRARWHGCRRQRARFERWLD